MHYASGHGVYYYRPRRLSFTQFASSLNHGGVLSSAVASMIYINTHTNTHTHKHIYMYIQRWFCQWRSLHWVCVCVYYMRAGSWGRRNFAFASIRCMIIIILVHKSPTTNLDRNILINPHIISLTPYIYIYIRNTYILLL